MTQSIEKLAIDKLAMEEPPSDFFRNPVPPERRVSGWAVALVVFGIGITLPIFYLGSELGQTLGLRDAAWAFFGGCLMLGVLATATAIVGARTGLSSYMIIEFSFGRDGAKIVNFLMAIALLGYFGATADIFGMAVHDAVRSIYGYDGGRWLYTFIGCLLMTWTAIFGFRSIERLSILTVPLMSLFMAYAVYLALSHTSWGEVLAHEGSAAKSLGLALSTVLGSSIQSAVLMPDVSRFCRTSWDGVKAVSGLAIGFPLVFLAAAVPTIVTGETDIMKIMIGLGIAIPALLMLLFSTWTTNTVNLYSTSMTLATVFTRIKEWKITLGSALLGTILALLGIMEHFIPFLLLLGVTTPPIGGIYLIDYFVLRGGVYAMEDLQHGRRINLAAFIAWVGGSTVGLATTYGDYMLTTVPAIDSLLIAGIIYYAAASYSRNRAKLVRG